MYQESVIPYVTEKFTLSITFKARGETTNWSITNDFSYIYMYTFIEMIVMFNIANYRFVR